MKEITIKIKPKLKWKKVISIFGNEPDGKPFCRIGIMPYGGFYLHIGDDSIGNIKTIKRAKEIAELLYQG